MGLTNRSNIAPARIRKLLLVFLLVVAFKIEHSSSQDRRDATTLKTGDESDPGQSVVNFRQSTIGNPLPEVTEIKLDNGLKVLLLEVHTTPLVSVWCWYRVGSKDEQIGNTGISHWVEHMNFKGTSSFPKGQIDRVIEDAGGFTNGYTYLDQTTYFETVAANALAETLKLEAERMNLSLFDPQEVRSERTVVISELQGNENDPKNLLDVEVTATALKVHPYRWPTGGWLKDLETMTRDQLHQYYRQYYIPNNAVLVLVGDFQTQEALDLVKKYFSSIQRKPEPMRVRTTEPEQEGEKRLKLIREGTVPYLEIAYRAPDILNDDFYAWLILDAVLQGAKGINLSYSPLNANAGKSSRLYKALIDKKLATTVNSSLVPTQNPYLYKLTVTLPDTFQYQPAEEAIYDELEKLKNYGITGHELSKAKNQWVTRTFLDQGTITQLGHQLGFFESIASHKLLDNLEEKINQVSQDDLRRVAIKYFDEKVRTVGWFVPAQKTHRVEVEKLAANCGLAIAEYGLRRNFFEPLPPGTKSPSQNKCGNLHAPSPGLRPPSAPVGAREKQSKINSPLAPTGRGAGGEGARNSGDDQSESPSNEQSSKSSHPNIRLKPQRKVLSNGVSIVLAENNTSPIVTVRASIKAGAMRDTDSNAGTANFVGQMLEHGTKDKTIYQLAEGFDFLGADFKTDTDYLVTSLTVKGLKKDVSSFIQLLAEMLQRPSFPPTEVEKVRTAILTELRQEAEDPQLVADQVLHERIYPQGHPFRRKVQGPVKTVEKLKLPDLLSFYKRFYRPDQLIIAVAGDVRPELVFEQVEKYFGSWSVPGTPEAFSISSVTPGLGAGEQLVRMKDKSQCDIAFGLVGVSIFSPDYYPMLVLNHILGKAGLGGRLGARIRDQEGLAYYVYSSLDASLGEGPLVIRAGVNPNGVNRTIALIKEEIEKIKAQGVTEGEVKAAKRYLINSLPTELESNEGIVEHLQHLELFQLGEDYLHRYADLIEEVRMDQLLNCLSTRILFDQAAMVIAGPIEPR